MKLHGILNSDAMKTLIWQIEIIPSLTPPAWRCVHTDFPSPFPFEAPSTCLQDKISTMSPGNLPKCMLQVLRGGGGGYNSYFRTKVTSKFNSPQKKTKHYAKQVPISPTI